MNKGVINIFDHIGSWGISSKKILETLNSFKEKNISDVEVRINSPGGSVFEGFSIFNQLRDYGSVTTIIDGIAASISSIIALAGDKVLAYKNSYIFVHNPWSISIGDTNDMNDSSVDLAKFRDTLIELYTSKTGLSEEELKEMCNKETFLSSNDALRIGLIDDIIDNYPSKKFVALYTQMFDEENNLIEEKSVKETEKETIEPTATDSSTATELLSAVSTLKEGFSALKRDLVNQLDTSFQLKIDLVKFENQLNQKITSGSLLPSMKSSILDILKFVTSEHNANSDEQTKTLLSMFDSLLDQLPNMQLLNEFVTKGDVSAPIEDEFDNYTVDDESFALHKQALAMSKENKISYKDALVSIMTINSN